MPEQTPAAELRFVVQRHRATRPHYDFRLELDGVLVSWAVPKGPTLDPHVRRGAFRTPDHPMEYLHFEGVIPAREYGGGDVTVWDAGTWRPDGSPADASRALARGELHFDLFGEKLRGRFVLIRTSDADVDKQQWLMLHKQDDFAVAGWDADQHPRSVLSGRTNDEVRADPGAMWRSDLPADRASIALKPDAFDGDELAELDALGQRGTWHVFGRAVRLADLDAEVFRARRPVTRRDLVRYAARIAPVAMSALAGRELAVPGARAPRWITGRAGTIVVDEPAALVWAAGAGAVEWQVKASPAFAVVDLEPPDGVRWSEVLAVARLYRAALDHLGVTGRPMLTGDRGLQIWIPAGGDDGEGWVRTLARTVASVGSDAVRSHAADAAARVIAPYSPRHNGSAAVATPLEWDELDDPGLRARQWTIRTVLDRLAARPDPFRAIAMHPQRLPRLE